MAENVDAADRAQALPAQRIEATDLGFAQGDALRVEDVTRILHVSRNTVYKLARSLLRTAAFRSEFDAAVYETRLMGEPVYEC